MSIHIARTRRDIGSGLVARILDTLEDATEDEYVLGKAWYLEAHWIASQVGPTTVQGAGIIAALSPQIGWVDNVAAARALALGDPEGAFKTFGCLGPNVDKATRILRGEAPLDVLGGRKVRSFYRNIVDPHHDGPVTVDRHALNLALVGPGGKGANDKLLARKGGYQLVAAAYRTAAREAWMRPNEVQAITWLVQRRKLDDAALASPQTNLTKAHVRQRRNVSS